VLATLTLGALALLPGATRQAAVAPALAVAAALGGACWGLYAVHAAPELAFGGAVAAPLLRLPHAPVALVAVGLVALFLALAGALSDRLAAFAPGRAPAMWTILVALAAVVAALRPVDPWTAWGGGLGLAGAAIAAPRLAAGGGAGKRLGVPVEAFGAFVGGAAFIALTVMAATLPLIGAFPALVAGPAAWLSVRLLRRTKVLPKGQAQREL
jgi:hypothetical protein